MSYDVRGIYGYTYDRKVILMNPDLSRDKQKLYLFHELAHMLVFMNYEFARKNLIQYCSINKIFMADIRVKYAIDGWVLLEEGIVQEIAESCFYGSLGVRRSVEHIQKESNVIGKVNF